MIHRGFVAVTRCVGVHGPPYHIRHPTLLRSTCCQPWFRRCSACCFVSHRSAMARRPPGFKTRMASLRAARLPSWPGNVVDGEAADDGVKAVVGERKCGHVCGVQFDTVFDAFDFRVGQSCRRRVVGLVGLPDIDADGFAVRAAAWRRPATPHRGRSPCRGRFRRLGVPVRRGSAARPGTCRPWWRRCRARCLRRCRVTMRRSALRSVACRGWR